MSDLILGWQVTPTLEPRYWSSPEAVRGGHSEQDLFRVSPIGLGAHTAIIAQSGSGKSFFLGRLVEEIVLRTKARCLVLDPNADFRRIHEIEHERLWLETVPYKTHYRAGKLTHELSREDFERAWMEITSVVRVGTPGGKKPYEQIQLPWPSVSADFLGEDLDPVQRSELYHCHEFVRILHRLLAGRAATERKIDYLARAENLLAQAMSNPSDFVSAMSEEFVDGAATQADSISEVWPFSIHTTDDFAKRLRERRIGQASAAARYVSPDVKRYYFGRLAEFRAAQIIDERAMSSDTRRGRDLRPRLEILDLPSLVSPSARLLAMSAMVAAEWDRARAQWDAALRVGDAEDDKRVPTFIVVDEAHNVIPHDTRSKAASALREQFRTIVAEGRKYGLFLILVSQRPDKLDGLVVSECENRAVMRMTSAAALDRTREMLALDDISPNVLAKCLDMPVGRVLIAGPWSPDGPDFMYGAARRTVEGGRNLRVKYWGADPIQLSASAKAPAKKPVARKEGARSARKKAPSRN